MYSQIDANRRKTLLLIVIFVVFIIFIGWVIGRIYPEYGYSPLFFAAIISGIMTLVSYFSGDKIALSVAGANGPIEKNDNPYVHRLVENLCVTAGVPLPKIYIIPDRAMNAFATGRDPSHGSIALTQGIIDGLENEELEGVVSHELSHIKNYDSRLMTIVVVLVGAIAILSNYFLRFRWGRRGSANDRGGGHIGAILMIIGIVLIVLSPIIAELIKLAISRKREFLADASGALLTRYPEGLARALEKIATDPSPLVRANTATAHLYIANPFSTKNIAKLFMTHPPIEERVKALRDMSI